MNLVMLAEVSLASVIGGAERVLREQATGLMARGHSVRALVRTPSQDAPSHIWVEGISERRYRPSIVHPIAFLFTSMLNSLRSYDAEIAKGAPDVVSIHQSLAGLGPILRRRSSARGWVYVCHSLSHEEYQSRHVTGKGHQSRDLLHVAVRRWIEKIVIRRCNRVVVLSQFMKHRVGSVHRIPGHTIRIIPGGADHTRFCPPDDRINLRKDLKLPMNKTILFTVRNLVPRMGLEALIQAMGQLGSKAKDCLLIIGGQGPLRGKLERLIASLGLSDRIHLVGFISEQDLPGYYQAADLVVMPTHELEGFGLVTVEALACGTPVLSTPIGALPEVLSKVAPELIAQGREPEHLAKSINTLLQRFRQDSGYWSMLSQRCRQVVEEHYTWLRHNQQIDEILRETLTTGKAV